MRAKIIPLIVLSLLFQTHPAYSAVSTNVPLDHWSYDDIDRLIGMGLINTALAGTRPYSRLKMALLTREAAGRLELNDNKQEIVSAVISRLKKKFKDELIYLKVIEGYSPASFLKPLNTFLFRYSYSKDNALLENHEGDESSRGSNYSASFSLRGRFWNQLGFYLQPEFELGNPDEDWHTDNELRQGYGKLELYNLEIEGGRDSFWWGPGRHGALFLTNNAKPYEYMIKLSNPRPVLLPSILEYLGPFQFTMFGAELEKERFISKAKLFGQRVNFKPNPIIELGFTRVFIWGGKGEDETLSSFYHAFFSKGGSEQNNSNYLTGMDFSIRIPDVNSLIPLSRTITLYGELGSDDEKNGFLNTDRMGYLGGLYLGDFFLTGRTDLRIEYAINNPTGDYAWYRHGYYKSGYSFKERVIGHHMGTNASDLFIRVTHYLTRNWLIGFSYDKERKSWIQNSSIEGDTQTRDQWNIDLTYMGIDNFRIRGGYRDDFIRNYNFKAGRSKKNRISEIDVIYAF